MSAPYYLWPFYPKYHIKINLHIQQNIFCSYFSWVYWDFVNDLDQVTWYIWKYFWKKTFSDSPLSIFTEWKSKIFTFYRTYCWTIFCVSIPAKYWVIKMTFPIKKLKTVLITIVFISTSICFYIDVYFKYLLYLILLLVVIQIRKLDEDFKNLLSSNM